MNPLTRVPPTPTTAQRLDAVEAKLDQITAQLQTLVDTQRPLVELREEAGSMAADVMRASVDQLEFLEQRGYFAFLRELKYLLDRVVEDYDPADLHALADNTANILDTVRELTQPPVMAAVRDMAETFSATERREPVGVFGLMRTLNRDKNVQRGLAFGLDVLSRLGRAVARAPRMSRKQLAAPTRTAAPVRAATPTPTPVRSEAVADDGRFVPDGEWSETFANSTASQLGLADLTAAHLDLVKQVRAEYVSAGATPNIRKITTITGMSTRDVYGLFPVAPAKTIARLAGVPKPVGCL